MGVTDYPSNPSGCVRRGKCQEMTTYIDRYRATPGGRAAVKRAWQKQAAKKKQEAAERRAKVDAYRQSLEGLTWPEIAAAMKQFKLSLRAEQEAQRQRERETREYWRQQRASQKLEENVQGERRRIERLIRDGIIEAMSEAERRDWIQQCKEVNPVMYNVLREKGVA